MTDDGWMRSNARLGLLGFFWFFATSYRDGWIADSFGIWGQLGGGVTWQLIAYDSVQY